ncbi:MAG TPA: DUF1540 domain-containing protein [Geobacterales bacterium]|nr:DUF1540 domain-containing protein [Geobacterales bacterium]
MAMKMSKITTCEAKECSYNRNMKCHALAITVGDMSHPMCDTFLKGSSKGGDSDSTGQVGACKVESCSHNKSLECSSPVITMGMHNGHADCKTCSLG